MKKKANSNNISSENIDLNKVNDILKDIESTQQNINNLQFIKDNNIVDNHNLDLNYISNLKIENLSVDNNPGSLRSYINNNYKFDCCKFLLNYLFFS